MIPARKLPITIEMTNMKNPFLGIKESNKTFIASLMASNKAKTLILFKKEINL